MSIDTMFQILEQNILKTVNHKQLYEYIGPNSKSVC